MPEASSQDCWPRKDLSSYGEERVQMGQMKQDEGSRNSAMFPAKCLLKDINSGNREDVACAFFYKHLVESAALRMFSPIPYILPVTCCLFTMGSVQQQAQFLFIIKTTVTRSITHLRFFAFWTLVGYALWKVK